MTGPETENGPQILVIDDDPDLLELIDQALTAHGYRVGCARNGREALCKLEEGRPRLLLLDMRMPVMDGWAFASELRRRHDRAIPIVVMTAAENARRRAEEIQADAYLSKPFELQQLYETVDRTIVRVD